MEAAGPTIIYMMLMVLQIIIGILLAAYASHGFLVVVQGTAAGLDEIQWPKDPYHDWLWKPVYLVWLVWFWLLPVGLVLRAADPPFLAETPFVRFLVLGFAGLWFLFPIALLSSLSANTRWVIFRPMVLRLMARQFGQVVFLYFVTAILTASGLACVYFALTSALGMLLILPAALVLSTFFFIYARLIGRLSWLLSKVELPLPKKPARQAPKRPRPVAAEDPWAPPDAEEYNRRIREEGPVITTKLDGDIASYLLADDEAGVPQKQQAAPQYKRPFDDPPEPYTLSKEEPPPRPDIEPLDGYRAVEDDYGPPPVLGEDERVAPDKYARRPSGIKPPAVPLVSGVYGFPWYATTAWAWFVVALGLTILGLLFKLQDQFRVF